MKRGLAWSLRGLGEVAQSNGNCTLARSLFEESVSLLGSAGYRTGWGTGLSIYCLGRLLQIQGNYEEATSALFESLTLLRRLEARRDVAACLGTIASLSASKYQYSRANRLLAASQSLMKSIAASFDPPVRADFDSTLAVVRAWLDTNELANGWMEGQAMSMEQAVVYALASTDSQV